MFIKHFFTFKIKNVMMDLQTRKLNVTEYLIALKDEKKFCEIEATVFENKPLNNKKLTPFTIQELIERANLSEKDYLTGRFKTQEQLEKESVNW